MILQAALVAEAFHACGLKPPRMMVRTCSLESAQQQNLRGSSWWPVAFWRRSRAVQRREAAVRAGGVLHHRADHPCQRRDLSAV